MSQASAALTKALWKVGPSVLSYRQQARFALTWALRRVLGPHRVAPFHPSFSGSAQHFLLHAGEGCACVCVCVYV